MTQEVAPSKSEYRCGFCGKTKAEVKRLIARARISWMKPPLSEVVICNECVELCMSILADDADWRDQQIERLKNLGWPDETEPDSN